MRQVTMEEVGGKIVALINEVIGGNDVVILQGDQPVAKIVSMRRAQSRRVFGSARNLIRIAPDFKAPLPDFAGYV